MKTKNKGFKNFGFWLLTDPKAFQVTMLMAAIGGTTIFGLLSILGWIFHWHMAITTIWSIFALLSGWKSYKYFKARKQLGDEQFGNYTLGDFMNVEQVEDEENEENDRERNNGGQGKEFCPEQSNADDEQPTGEKYQDAPGRILESSEESEPTDDGFFDLIQEPSKDEPKL